MISLFPNFIYNKRKFLGKNVHAVSLQEVAPSSGPKRMRIDGFVKSLFLVITRSPAFAGRRTNLVFTSTYKNEIALLSLPMTLS